MAVSHKCDPTVLALLCLCATAHADSITIPAGEARWTLDEFADQAPVDIFFYPDYVDGIKTNAVQGEYNWKEALRKMLAGTGLWVLKGRILSIAPPLQIHIQAPVQSAPAEHGVRRPEATRSPSTDYPGDSSNAWTGSLWPNPRLTIWPNPRIALAHPCSDSPVQFALGIQPMDEAIAAWIRAIRHYGMVDTTHLPKAIPYSQAVHGRYRPTEALNRLLAPSRMHARALATCRFELEPDPPAPPAPIVHNDRPALRECVCQFFDSFGLRIPLSHLCEEDGQLRFEDACDGTVRTVLH
jgi:hypothetical protein